MCKNRQKVCCNDIRNMVFHHQRRQNKYHSKTVSRNDDIQNAPHATTKIFFEIWWFWAYSPCPLHGQHVLRSASCMHHILVSRIYHDTSCIEVSQGILDYLQSARCRMSRN